MKKVPTTANSAVGLFSFFRLTTCPNKGIAFLEEDYLIEQLYVEVTMGPGKEQNGSDFVFKIFSQSSHIFSHERN